MSTDRCRLSRPGVEHFLPHLLDFLEPGTRIPRVTCCCRIGVLYTEIAASRRPRLGLKLARGFGVYYVSW